MMDPDRKRCCDPNTICRHAPIEYPPEGAPEFADRCGADAEVSQLAFIRRRMPTVVEFAANVHREDYQVPDEDRATLARVADDLMFTTERAEVWRGQYEQLVDEPFAVDLATLAPEVAEVLRWFEYAQLPPHLRATSRRFAVLAHRLVQDLPASAELVAGLRSLLQAKDSAVRCAVVDDGERPEAGQVVTRERV